MDTLNGTLPLAPGAKGGSNESKRQRLDVLAGQLKTVRQPMESDWQQLDDFFKPRRRLRLNLTDTNKGSKRSTKLVDSSPAFAARTFQAGMTSGITSSARSWFKMTLDDKTLLEQAGVKEWLEETRKVFAAALLNSNFYATIPVFFGDLGVFATSALIAEEDDTDVVRFTNFAPGEYWIGMNASQQVRVFMREFVLTVRQVVEQFGKKTKNGYSTENLSTEVQSAWRTGNTESPVQVRHLIYENAEYSETRIEAKHKRYASCYYELAGRTDVFLHEGGYDEWPVMAVRWEANSGDVYGTDCPGMTALADSKELQFSKKIGAQALNKAVNPPMAAPVMAKNVALSILPGGVSYFDEVNDKKIRPLIDTSSFRLDYLQAWVGDLRDLIKRAFYEDLFLIISQIDRGDVTATEVLEKKEEKLLALGPALEQVNGGLDELFDRLFGILLRRGLIPEPPPELGGTQLHPEYESIMAQAQRAQGKGAVQDFVAFTTGLIAMNPNDPSVLDNINQDEIARSYQEMGGVPPKFIRSEEEVAALREGRAKAQAQQAMADQAEQLSGAAKNLAASDTSGQNALTDLVGAGAAPLGGAMGGF